MGLSFFTINRYNFHLISCLGYFVIPSGFKRLLYERLGVKEYWVIDGNNNDIIAFEIIDSGSKRIEDSKVLPGLQIAIVKEAMQRSQHQDDGGINRWLLEIFK
ncbi:MAG: hypothetical protein ACKO3K_13800 [Cuspidothrix sp.]